MNPIPGPVSLSAQALSGGILLRRNLVAALLYLLAGGLGITLTLSSGYASPIWPAAGVAVTVLLIWGRRCWPGIWLGGFLIDSWFDASASGLLLSAITAGMATAQALIGAWLARCHLQANLPFTSDWRLGLFLVLAGPLACLLSSSMGTLVLYSGGRLDESGLLGEWLRWWTGDTLGVLLFTPLSLLLWPRAHGFLILGTGNYRFVLPLIVTAALLVLGHIGLAHLQELRARNQHQALMEIISNEHTLELAETLLPLEGLAHFFAASEEVTRAEFRRYTTSFLKHPAILSVDWAPRLKADQRVAFEAAVRAEGIEPFGIQELDQEGELSTASYRPEYFPILFSEPLIASRHVLGLDHGFDAKRMSAMTQARETGGAVASGQLPLARTNRQASLVYIPVWRLTNGQQAQQLAGFVVGVIDMHQFFSPLLKHAQELGLLTRISDVTSDNPTVRLIDDIPADIHPDWRHDFRFNGRVWRLEMQPANPYWQPGSTSEEHFFLGFAVLMSLLAVFATLSSAGRHSDIRRQVGERTAQLRHELEARSAAEAALHSSEERYRRLIELSPFGILVQCQGYCRFVNASTIKMFGASSAEQLLGQPLLDFIHPDSTAIVLERLQRRTEGLAAPESTVVHYRRLDGSYSWVEFTSVAYQYEGQSGSLVLLNDISERIRAEEQRDRFFTLSLDLFCIASTDGYFKTINPAFTQMLGWSEEELLRRPILDFVHPDDIDATRNELALLDKNDSSTLGFENRYRCKDGSWRRLAWKALPQPGKLLFATARDITEQYQAEQRLTELNTELTQRIEERGQALAALHAQKEEIRAVLDHLLECVITIDSRGLICRVNPAIRPLLGYDPEELLGQNVSCLMDSPLKEQHDEYLARYLRTGKRNIIGSSREVTGRHKSGHAVSLELSVSEFHIHGEPFFVGTLRDIRERKALIASLTLAREEAEQASRAKSAFLATMSHEIRTPMNGVMGLVDVLMHDQLSSYQQDLVSSIRQSATHLLAIIDDILDFSKIEAGKLDIELRATPLNALLEDQWRAFTPLATTKEVDLLLHLPPGHPQWIYTDPVRLRQILANLVGNAIKFSAREHQATTRRGRVEVNAALTNTGAPQLILDIMDNGIGIAVEHVPNLFMPFTQMESSTTRRFGGTGLGLAICRRLVDLMDGEITVESQPGQGTRFRVRLPARPAPAPAKDRPDDVIPPPRTATGIMRDYLILVAEDDAINRKVILHQLGLLGYRCEAAHNGQEALALWRDRAYDLLITDLHMPEMDGYELAQHIRREEPGPGRLPILTLTANAQRDEAARALAMGVDEYLIKPLRLDALETVLARWLPHAAMTAPHTVALPPAAEDDAILDTRVLAQMIGDDPRLMADTLRDYAEALDSLGIRLEDACTLSDYPTIAALAHRLKSSSKTVGAQRLASLFSQLEEAARHGDATTVANAAGTLPEQRQATQRAITQNLSHPQARERSKHENPGD